MGKDKAMVGEGLSKDFFLAFFKKQGKILVFISALSIVLSVSPCSVVFADEKIKKSDFNLTFYEGLKEIEFGAVDCEKIEWHVALETGLRNSTAFDVYDCKGNKIQSGSSGSIRMDKNYFPIKFVARTDSVGDWRVTVSISKVGGDEKGSGGGKDYTDILNQILEQLKKLNDFLSNKKYLEDGVGAVQDSMEKLENYSPVKQNIGSLGSLGSSSSSLPKFDINFGKIGTFNVFDLSKFADEISMIKKIMTAILWIELAMFFVRIFMPKLKV